MIPLQNITTLFFLFIILIGRSDSTYFCDLKAIDNVFNVGHLVYMTRCGEVWTYDPRMYAEKSRGGFIRDYSWFAFAKRFFAHNLFNEHKTYDNKLLHFAAFSFQEVNCDETFENLDKDCYGSVKAWNGLSVMADKYEARTFRYETDMEHLKNNNDNPLGFGGKQLMNTSERNAFWPDIQDVAKDWLKMNLGPGKGSVHSALFSVKENTLYIGISLKLTLYIVSCNNQFQFDPVLQANNSKYYCLTHTNMNEMLHDVRRWPTKKGNGPQWAKCKPFTGNVVGMFYDENQGQAYIVGRVRYDHRKYEDTIYYLNIDSPDDNDELVPIDPIIIVSKNVS